MPLYFRYFLGKIKRIIDRWASSAFAVFMVAALLAWASGITRASLLAVIPAPIKLAAHGVVDQISRWGMKVSDLPFFAYRFRSSPLPVFDIVVSEKKLDELDEYFKEHQSEYGREKLYKNAKFISDGKEYDVEISYRGDENVHFVNEKKSWRIKFAKDNYFRGMKSANLIIPEDRLFLGEYFNNYRARKLGIPAPKDDFVGLRVNGRSKGVYFMVEQWNAALLEKAELNSDANLYGEAAFGVPDLYYDVSAWQKYAENPNHDRGDYSDLKALLSLLSHPSDEFFWKNIPTLLDMDEFYRWQVHSALSGSPHQDNIHNARLYFDPTIGKFKFLPWDVYIRSIDYSGSAEYMDFFDYNPLVQRILKNPEFLDQRNKILWEYVKDDKNLEEDLRWYDQAFDRARIAFYQDTAKLYSNWFFRDSAAEIKKLIEANFFGLRDMLKNTDLSVGVTVNLPAAENDLTGTPIAFALDIAAKSLAPQHLRSLEIKGLSRGGTVSLFLDANQNKSLDSQDRMLSRSEIQNQEMTAIADVPFVGRGILKSTDEDSGYELNRTVLLPSVSRLFILAVKNNVNVSPRAQGESPVGVRLRFANGITGEETEIANDRFADAGRFERMLEPGMSIDQFLARNPAFSRSGRESVRLSRGTHIFHKSVIIPRGLSVQIDPGASLFLGKDVSIISHSPVRMVGTAYEPIAVSRLESSKPWGSFVIVGTDANRKEEKNIIRFSRFSGGSTSFVNGIFTSGMLAAHGSSLELTDSEITVAGGDDGVNVKNAEVKIFRNRFAANSSDALDLDFVQGTVSENVFMKNGNDGVDVSGSRVLILDNAMIGNGDKGVSVGENSYPDIVNNVIAKGKIGIAVKDQSDAFILQNTIVANKSGIELYQKKQAFAGGVARMYNTILWGNESGIAYDANSSLEIRGSDVEKGVDGVIAAEFSADGTITASSGSKARSSVEIERVLSVGPRFVAADSMDFALAAGIENKPLLTEGIAGRIQGNIGSYDASGLVGAAPLPFKILQ